MTIDVAVIGAGVSGLATAHELMRRGHRVVVLERQQRAGGNAISERLGGFLMEHGPSSVSAASADAEALSTALGLDGLRRELGSAARYRYLVRGGALHAIATHPFAFLTSGYLSLGGRLRLMAEGLVRAKRADDDETVAEFWRRRCGREFAERVIDPFVGGLSAGRPAELSMAAVFPALLEMERRHGSLTRAMVASRLAGGTMPGRRLYSWRDGVGALPRRLARRLGAAVKTGVAVRRIRPLPGGFRVDAGNAGAFDAAAVVVATQPHVAAALLEGVDGAGTEAAAAIEAPPLAVVFLGYRRQQIDHPLDGLGYLTPVAERRALSGALFCSTMFVGRAPVGHVSLAGYVGGARAPELARLPAAELIAQARADFHELVGARGEPVVARVRHWPRGLPQYGLGHGRRVGALRGVEQRRPGLVLTGNYFAGLSIAACLEQARQAAARLHEFLLARAQKATPPRAARRQSQPG